VLEQHNAEILEERSTRKMPLQDNEVVALLEAVDEVLIGAGQKIVALEAEPAIAAALKGPTGKYRAPMVRRGGTLLVGWNAEALAQLMG
jgi:hypothetical protein